MEEENKGMKPLDVACIIAMIFLAGYGWKEIAIREAKIQDQNLKIEKQEMLLQGIEKGVNYRR